MSSKFDCGKPDTGVDHTTLNTLKLFRVSRVFNVFKVQVPFLPPRTFRFTEGPGRGKPQSIRNAFGRTFFGEVRYLIGGAFSKNSRFNVDRGASPHGPLHAETHFGAWTGKRLMLRFCFPPRWVGLTDGGLGATLFYYWPPPCLNWFVYPSVGWAMPFAVGPILSKCSNFEFIEHGWIPHIFNVFNVHKFSETPTTNGLLSPCRGRRPFSARLRPRSAGLIRN